MVEGAVVGNPMLYWEMNECALLLSYRVLKKGRRRPSK